LQSVTFDTLPCGRVLFAAFVLSCLFSIAAVYMANKVEYIIINNNTHILITDVHTQRPNSGKIREFSTMKFTTKDGRMLP